MPWETGNLTATISILEVIWTLVMLLGCLLFTFWAVRAQQAVTQIQVSDAPLRLMARIRVLRYASISVTLECWLLVGLMAMTEPPVPTSPVLFRLTAFLLTFGVVLLIAVWIYIKGLEQRLERKTTNVLVVDDDEAIQMLVVDTLQAEGYMAKAMGPEDALRVIEAWPPDVAVVDLMMPTIDGRQVISRIRAIAPWVRVILYSARTDSAGLEALTGDLRIDAYLAKPFNLDDLVRAVRGAR